MFKEPNRDTASSAFHSTAVADMAPKSFLDLPNELILEILNLVVENDTPFYAQAAIGWSRRLKALKLFDMWDHTELASDGVIRLLPPWTADRAAERVRLRKAAKIGSVNGFAYYTSLTALKEVLPDDQGRHVQDWAMITGTCKLIKELGTKAFFEKKILFFSAATLYRLNDQPVTCVGDEFLALAFQRAWNVILSVRATPSQILHVPRIQRLFSAAKRLGIYSEWLCLAPDENLDLTHLGPWHPLPKPLEKILVSAGLNVKSMKVSLLCKEDVDFVMFEYFGNRGIMNTPESFAARYRRARGTTPW